MQVERRSNETRTRETRNALLDAARAVFVELGYADSSTPMIVTRAGTTRGALYHHYPDKKAIFRAVLDREAAQVAAAIAAVDIGSEDLSPLESLLRGADAYLDAMQIDGRTRLLLVDGPAILGPREMAEVEAQHARGSLDLGLADLMAGTGIDQPALIVLSDLLSAMFDRAALAVAEGAPLDQYRTAIHRVLKGLVADVPHRRPSAPVADPPQRGR